MIIYAKRLGKKLLSLVFNGKPKQISTESEEEMNELVQLVKDSHEGNEEAQKQLEAKAFPKKTVLPELTTLENEVKNTESQIQKTNEAIEIQKRYTDVFANSQYFEVKEIDGREALFLKGFKSELPPIVADHFVKAIIKGEKVENLAHFWMWNMLNRNKNARLGLYKFIQKQKLYITEGGYFIAFRRIRTVQDSKEIIAKVERDEETADFNNAINTFQVQVKKWKKTPRSFEVYYHKTDKKYVLKPVSKHDVNRAKGELDYRGILFDCIEKIKLEQEAVAQENTITLTPPTKTYTDAHTGTMVIRLMEPVKMNRSRCNEDGRVDCSYGLHVGSEAYVANNSSLGDTIVLVLVNPMHVVSVPYSDAHKMRTCEYLPVLELTRDELINFDPKNYDLTPYINNYKKIETKRLQQAGTVEELLTTDEFKSFSVTKNIKTPEDLQKLMQELEEKKQKLATSKKEAALILDDNINDILDFDEVRTILQSRLQS